MDRRQLIEVLKDCTIHVPESVNVRDHPDVVEDALTELGMTVERLPRVHWEDVRLYIR